MRVAVCCKGVPIDATIETVQISQGDIQFKGTDFYINPTAPESAAHYLRELEEAAE